GEDVLDRPVVHVEHDALQLPLTGREEAPRGGAGLGVPNVGHRGSARSTRSATKPSAAPIARAMATRTPPSIVTARSPIATPAPAATTQASPTSTGQSDRFTLAISEIAVHTATTAARLSPRAVIAFIALPPSV